MGKEELLKKQSQYLDQLIQETMYGLAKKLLETDLKSQQKIVDIGKKLQIRLQKLFDKSQDKDEQTFLAFQIGELGLKIEILEKLKSNKNLILYAADYIIASSQAIENYEPAQKI
ncbi:MAG: hypothetical protein QMD50_03165 [Patescibacteria group bacterium]|nr:hypothetical protein [Patescibacteria group bacterium]